MCNIMGTYLMPHPPIIIEQIGRGEEKKANKTIESIEVAAKDIKSKAPSTIVLITPHGPLFSDAIAISGEKELVGDFRKFGFANLSYGFQNNLELVEKILYKTSKEDIATIRIDKNTSSLYNIESKLDHGALVPLHFIDKEYQDYKLVHITYGLLSPKDLYRFGQVIKDSVVELGEKAVVIASGDLSHKLSHEGPYGFSKYGKRFDEKIINIIEEGNLKDITTFDLSLAEKAGECGLRSLMIMVGTLDRYDIKTKILSYEGPFGVGYGIAIIDVEGKKDKNILAEIEMQELSKIKNIRDSESDYVKLARKALEYFISTGKYLKIDKQSDIRRGVFVSLKKDGMLRGCIGTIEATTESVENETIQNAVSAGTRDSRFERVKEEELEKIVYSVDILFEAEPVDSIEELDVEKYGIIVSKGFKRGLLLPNIEGVDTVEHQIEIALSKAGIKPKEEYNIEKFKVVRYH